MSTLRRDSQPFLDDAPPPWAARSLATVLILLFVVTVFAVFLVQVPETVTATFLLEPVRGADPVRALHPGVVSEVRVQEAQAVDAGALLFVLASELVGDRASERTTVDARLSGGRDRLGNERTRFENQVRADEQEQHRLEQSLAGLTKQADLKSQQLALVKEVAARRGRGFDAGVSSWLDANLPKLEVNQLAVEIEQLQASIADARGTLARLTFEMAARRAAFAEIERGINEDMTTYRARKDMLDRDASGRRANAMSIVAPCAGTIVKMLVRQPGAVVDANALLAEMVCDGEPLRATLSMPEGGLALVRTGQSVKLLYDAFPHARYGVQYAHLTWLSPASTPGPNGPSFRAFADLTADSVHVRGDRRKVLPGMTGRAAVVVGRRSLASYAIEPIRQLRDSLASAPAAASEPAASRPSSR